MTVSMIDLLKRSAPFVITALALAACTDKEIETNVALLKGDPTPDQIDQAKLLLTPEQFASASSQFVAQQSSSSMPPVMVSSSSSPPSVEPVQVVVMSSSVEPPAPPPCDPVVWRGTIYDCTMMHILGYVE